MMTDPDHYVPSDRERRGGEVMRSIGIDPNAVIASVAPVDKQFGHTIVEYAFGEIIARPELDLRTRQLVTVAVLAAIGGCEAQLEVHIPATLRAGATSTEIIAVLTHLTPYVGIPRTLNALYLAKELLAAESTKGVDADAASASDTRSV
ncbi:carboxymuconolactone decarboxylase family protein [Prescottella agglutinans]|uniref:4-carboxymuconolactone decarboxylase n=1 Tax=Prescottella agglutinans TaxID=1644129 RepID=A0ABT6M6C8_9NOCA|nr:carboxymuconolactone decarboxylase family protein [Prescottella agglutinans]MDH6279868.1 4-carboxymuconolactone decarboxylase [Prescottella agglutinans]